MDEKFGDLLHLYQGCSTLTKFFLRRSIKVIPYRQIESYVPPQGNILDFGCGHGIFTNLLALSSDRRHLTGYDIDERKIKIASRTIQDRRNVRFSSDDVLGPEAKYHGVILISVLYLVPYKKQEQILQNLVTTLVADGKLIIVEFDKKPRWKYWLGYFREYMMTTFYTKSEGLYYRSSDEYLPLLASLNLEVKKYPLNMLMYPSVAYVCSK